MKSKKVLLSFSQAEFLDKGMIRLISILNPGGYIIQDSDILELAKIIEERENDSNKDTGN